MLRISPLVIILIALSSLWCCLCAGSLGPFNLVTTLPGVQPWGASLGNTSTLFVVNPDTLPTITTLSVTGGTAHVAGVTGPLPVQLDPQATISHSPGRLAVAGYGGALVVLDDTTMAVQAQVNMGCNDRCSIVSLHVWAGAASGPAWLVSLSALTGLSSTFALVPVASPAAFKALTWPGLAAIRGLVAAVPVQTANGSSEVPDLFVLADHGIITRWSAHGPPVPRATIPSPDAGKPSGMSLNGDWLYVQCFSGQVVRVGVNTPAGQYEIIAEAGSVWGLSALVVTASSSVFLVGHTSNSDTSTELFGLQISADPTPGFSPFPVSPTPSSKPSTVPSATPTPAPHGPGQRSNDLFDKHPVLAWVVVLGILAIVFAILWKGAMSITPPTQRPPRDSTKTTPLLA
jgi:hypothetical protein